jgi:hypothetical protein
MTTTANEPLFREIISTIEVDPDSWSQDDYIKESGCGTTYCIAGWALVLSGQKGLFTNNRQEAHDAARRLLRLDEHQADDIFLFTSVDSDGLCDCEPGCQVPSTVSRHPTLDEMKARITEVTGIVFKTEDQ